MTKVSSTAAQQTRKQKRQVALKEIELKKINTKYNKYAKQAKIQGRAELNRIREQTKVEEIKQIQRKEKIIVEMKKSLEKTKADIKNMEQSIKNENDKKLMSDREVSDQRFSALSNKHNEKILELNDNAHFNLKQNRFRTENAIDKNRFNNINKVKSLTNEAIASTTALENNFDYVIQNKQNDQFFKLKSMKSKHENEFKKMKRANYNSFTTTKLLNDNEMEMAKKSHLEKMAQANQGFNGQYTDLLKIHNGSLNRLADHAKVLENGVKRSLAEVSAGIVDKANDKFYRNIIINSNISENEKSYTISIKVPAHEKKSVPNLSEKEKCQNLHVSKFSRYLCIGH